MPTPKSNLALFLTLVRLPVVVNMIATLRSKKSLGVVPHSTTPGGCTPALPRSTQYCSASMTFGSSNLTAVPASFARIASFGVVSVWKSQYGKPLDGIWTPHCVTLPLASFFVSLPAASLSSAQFVGGLLGSRPASLKASLFQYMTTVERWNGMPQVFPPVWLF